MVGRVGLAVPFGSSFSSYPKVENPDGGCAVLEVDFVAALEISVLVECSREGGDSSIERRETGFGDFVHETNLSHTWPVVTGNKRNEEEESEGEAKSLHGGSLWGEKIFELKRSVRPGWGPK